MTKRSLAELSAAAKRRVLLCAASAVVALGESISVVAEASRDRYC